MSKERNDKYKIKENKKSFFGTRERIQKNWNDIEELLRNVSYILNMTTKTKIDNLRSALNKIISDNFNGTINTYNPQEIYDYGQRLQPTYDIKYP